MTPKSLCDYKNNISCLLQCEYSVDDIKNNINNLDNIPYNELKKIILQLIKQLDLHVIKINNVKNNVKNNNVKNNNYNIACNNYNELRKNYTDLNKTYTKKITQLKNKIKELEDKTQSTSNTCCVCLTETSNHANSKCGHLCVCETCSYHLDDKCPICRADGPFIKIICS